MIGYTPQQVNEMSVWQYFAAAEGYVEAHSSEEGKKSEAEVDAIWQWMQEKAAMRK